MPIMVKALVQFILMMCNALEMSLPYLTALPLLTITVVMQKMPALFVSIQHARRVKFAFWGAAVISKEELKHVFWECGEQYVTIHGMIQMLK